MSFLFQNIQSGTRKAVFFALVGVFLMGFGLAIPVLSHAQDVEVAEVQEVAIDADGDEGDDFEAVAEVEAVNAAGVQQSKMTAAKRFQLTQIFLVEIEELKQACELDKKQLTKIRIGAKGAVKKLTAEWKKKTGGQIGFGQPVQQGAPDKQPAVEVDEIEIQDADEIDENTLQMLMMNMGNGNPYRTSNPLEHRFWKKTVANVLTEQQLKEFKEIKTKRQRAKRKALIDGTVGCMKIELGLSDEQTVEFDRVIRPVMEDAKMDCIALYEPYLIYYYASKADAKKLKEVLLPAQLQKWKIFMAPMKQVGQMIEMEDGDDGFEEEENILMLIGHAIEAIAEGVEGLFGL